LSDKTSNGFIQNAQTPCKKGIPPDIAESSAIGCARAAAIAAESVDVAP